MFPPILFLHAAFASGKHFDSWARRFEAAGFECFAPSLPGHDPSDPCALARLSMSDYFDAVLEHRRAMRAPPIVIGHSLGGLLGQKLAARTPCAALVTLASVPPGILWAQPRAMPHLVPLLPGILAGRAIHPSTETNLELVFHDLPRDEQRDLCASLGHDSGRVYRSMLFGSIRIPRGAIECPVLCISGGADRIVSAATSRSIAARYHAEHRVLANRGHWIVAESAVDEVAPMILHWLRGRLMLGDVPTPRREGTRAALVAGAR